MAQVSPWEEIKLMYRVTWQKMANFWNQSHAAAVMSKPRSKNVNQVLTPKAQQMLKDAKVKEEQKKQQSVPDWIIYVVVGIVLAAFIGMMFD